MAINMIQLLLLPLSLPFLFLGFSVISQSLLPPYPGSQGQWQLLHESVGISAMHMQLLRDNKVIIFDRTDFGLSNISLPDDRCRNDLTDLVLKFDCSAHSILYDVATNTFRPLFVLTDTWCSSGSVLPDGTLVQTGGFNDGDHVVRTFTPCNNDGCDWVEFPNYLAERRWYATNQILPDGRVIIVGGRRQFNYEFYPKTATSSQSIWLDFLRQTTDVDENNLYPFLHLLPDGSLFMFANTRSILFDYNQNRVIKEFPQIPGEDPRNYPSTGSSVLLPLDENKASIEAEILVCGGAPRDSFPSATRGVYLRAVSTCGRLKVTDQNPEWVMEDMPIPRVMGDMLFLPTGDVIIINGAVFGTAGWGMARDPALRPVIYRPTQQPNWRFSVMSSASRARLYHSSAVLLADGRVLVGGSNPNMFYNFTGVLYPTDLSIEAFSPPYLSPEYARIRPRILSLDQVVEYGKPFTVPFLVEEYLTVAVLSVRIIAPSFTTHSLAMNQRMVVLGMVSVESQMSDMYALRAIGPSCHEIAPPGYYMLFVVHAGIPSNGMWLKIQ